MCVLFFDGLSDEAFSRLVSEGALPNLTARIVDRALSVQTAVTSVPSETYPNLASLETGLLPGHHGIPANIWLDRRLQVREAHTNVLGVFSSTDYLAPEARTLFERLSTEMAKVVKQPDIVKRFTELGIDAVGSSPADYAALNKTEYEKYGKLVKETGAKVD